MTTPPSGSSSLWQLEAEAKFPKWPQNWEGSLSCDCLVVGAGLAGSILASKLQHLGADVVVVDAAGPGRGATGRNAGFLLLGNAVEYPDLRRRLGPEDARTYLELGRENHRILRDGYAEQCQYEPGGSLMLAMSDDGKEVHELHEAAKALLADGVDCTLETPISTLHGFARQLRIHEDAQLHPGLLIAAVSSGITRGYAGVKVHDLDLFQGLARTDAGSIEFKHAFVTTNGLTGQLLPAFAELISPKRAQMLATAPLPRELPLPIYAGWGYEYFRQRQDGRILLGGRRHLHLQSEDSEIAEPTDRLQADLETYLRRHLPFARDVEITHRWAGIMGFTTSGLPLYRGLNPEGARASATVLAGFTGHGMGMAAACGEMAAARWAGSSTPEQDEWAAMLRRASTQSLL